MPTTDIPKLPTTAENCILRISPPRLLNCREAARYIGVSERTIRSWIAERKIRVSRLGGRIVLRLVDVDRYVESKLEGGLV